MVTHTGPVAPDSGDHDNNLAATGAMLAILAGVDTPMMNSLELVADANGIATNQIYVGLAFLGSTYRLTIDLARD